VVCGSRHGNADRLPSLDNRFGPTERPIRAELHMAANAVIGLQADTVMVDHVPSTRLMVTYKLRF
jgi:hypothetical protein